MSGEEFSVAAADFPEPFRLMVRESVESTNDEVRVLARAGAAEGLIILAEHQTAGRGRRGAAWFSPVGESLAFSILVRPSEPKALWPRLALAAGIAVAEAVEGFGVQAGIKWPNDVWIGRKKIAGILVEAGTDFAVVGIGVNVNCSDFPAEVSEIATSLKIETSVEFSRAEVLAAIVAKFAKRRLQIGVEFEALVAAVSERCVLTGNEVSLITAAGPRTGTVTGIAAGGELLLLTASGVERLIQADEIRLTSG